MSFNTSITQNTQFKTNDVSVGDDYLLTGIPCVLNNMFGPNGSQYPGTIFLRDDSNNIEISIPQNGLTGNYSENVTILLESTLVNNSGSTLSINDQRYFFNSDKNLSTPGDGNKTYKIARYYTSITDIPNIDMNSFPNVIIAWTTADLTNPTYGTYKIILTLKNSDGLTVKTYTNKTCSSTSVPSTLVKSDFSRLPTGTYSLYFDFTNGATGINYTRTASDIPKTKVFSFESENVTLHFDRTTYNIGSTATITVQSQYGYLLNSYELTFYDDATIIDTVQTTFPHSYTFIASLFTRNGSYSASITNPNGVVSTALFEINSSFINDIQIYPKIFQSTNLITWSGGLQEEGFEYGTQKLYDAKNDDIFIRGDSIDLSDSKITYNTGYLIKPSNSSESGDFYVTHYFDFINDYTHSEQVVTMSEPFLSETTVISWVALYTANNNAPDTGREYTISFNDDGKGDYRYPIKSDYNTLLVGEYYTNLFENTPYTIKVEDIIIATNFYFFEKPDVVVTPSYINFKNKISWNTPDSLTITIINTPNLTYDSISSQYETPDFVSPTFSNSTNYDIQCSIPSRSSSSQLCGTLNLTLQTFDLFWDGTTNTIFDGVVLSDETFKDDFLYPNGTYILSLSRVDDEVETIIPLTDNDGNSLNNITFGESGYIWYPYQTNIVYEPTDKLLLTSNTYRNFGYSHAFTLDIPTPTVLLDKKDDGSQRTEFTFVSIITATIVFAVDYIDTFTVTLCATDKTPISLTEYTTSSSIYIFKPYENYNAEIETDPENIYFFQNNDVYLHFESNSNSSITFDSNPFKINPNYLTITNENRKYYTIEKNIFTLTYNITTTSDYEDIINISIFPFPIYPGTTPINSLTNILSSSTFTYDFYAYKHVKDEIYLTSSLYLIFQSLETFPIILYSNSFTLDGNSITSSNDGESYNILDTIKILWEKIDNVTTDYIVSEFFDLTAIIDNIPNAIGTSKSPFTLQINDSLFTENFDIYIKSESYLIFTTINITVNNNIIVELDEEEYTIISTVTATIGLSSGTFTDTYGDIFKVDLYALNDNGDPQLLEATLPDFEFSNDVTSYLFYPFKHVDYTSSVYLLFTSTNITDLTIKTNTFSIISDYLTITIPDLQGTYYTIESIPFTLTYDVTTTSIFTETVTAVVESETTETPASYYVDLSSTSSISSKYAIVNDWYPYKYVFDENNLDKEIHLTINSISKHETSNPFKLDGHCISSTNNGESYSILTSILISWKKIDDVTTDYTGSELFNLTSNIIILRQVHHLIYGKFTKQIILEILIYILNLHTI